jgi:hypothetical protein
MQIDDVVSAGPHHLFQDATDSGIHQNDLQPTGDHTVFGNNPNPPDLDMNQGNAVHQEENLNTVDDPGMGNTVCFCLQVWVWISVPKTKPHPYPWCHGFSQHWIMC